MSLPWFRMYAEFLSDPLIRMLAFEDQRHFIAALCLKCSGVLDKEYPSADIRRSVIASLLGLNEHDGSTGKNALDQANSRLRRLGLVDEDWQPVNWEKRQFRSDHSDPTAAERMRRYRAKKHETPPLRPPVTDVTALDSEQIQNRTDTEQRERRAAAPRATRKCPDDWLPSAGTLATLRQTCPQVDLGKELEKFRDHTFAVSRHDWDATYRNWVRRAAESGSKRGGASRKTYDDYEREAQGEGS